MASHSMLSGLSLSMVLAGAIACGSSPIGGGTGGAAGSPGVGGSAGSFGGGVIPPVDSVEIRGPFATTTNPNAGPSRNAWLVHPTDLGQNGLRHPLFIWGPGAGTTPSNYTDHLNHWASHGFVVYSTVSTSDGSEIIAALNWLEAQNNQASSPYYGKLDLTRIAAGGHSRGSISTFAAARDPRIRTTIHVAGGSFDGNGPSNLRNPAAYTCGENDTLATPNCERDYARTAVPVFFTIMQGVDHIMAARSGLPAITAWLRWHVGGEASRRGMFLGPGCTFCSGLWQSQSKNW